MSGIAKDIINLFLETGTPLNVGIIGKFLTEDKEFAQYLQSISTSPLIEIFDNSYSHGEYEDSDLKWQKLDLASAQSVISSVVGKTPSAFVPPYYEYDTNTPIAMKARGLYTMSASCVWDPNEVGTAINCPEGSDVVAPHLLWNGVYMLPAGATMGDLDYWEHRFGRMSVDSATEWIDTQIGKRIIWPISLSSVLTYFLS